MKPSTESRREEGGNSPVALITGGGRRLGRQIALALGREGFDLVVNYHHSREEALSTVASLSRMGRRAIALHADVSRKSQVVEMVARAQDHFGRIDLLVNNAAVFTESPLDRTTERIWDKTLDTNLKGPFLCSQAVSGHMLRRKTGRIINIASLGGIQSWARYLPYCVSKAGVIMLTRLLAKSLAPHIRVNAIAPGTTIIRGEEDPSVSHIDRDKILLKKYGTPRDITDAVIFLALKVEYMTGQVLVVDGGRSIQ